MSRSGMYFILRNKLKPHLVLQIEDGVDKPDAPLVARDLELNDSHLWFTHSQTSTVRNKLNSFCLHHRDGWLCKLSTP